MPQLRPSPSVLRLLALALLALTACSTPAATGEISGAQMAEANQLYEEGQFAAAAARYQALVDAGVQEGHLYYNLGDAYFKLGDLGRAVLNFRRAQRLLPRDGDVTANLRLARSQTVDRIDVEDKGALVDLVRRIVGWTTIDEAAALALAIWVLLCGLLISAILWQRRRRPLLYLAGAVAVLLFFGVLSIGIRLLDERGRPPAVVVAEEVPLRSGPGEDYLTEFTLHAGAEVRVVEQRGGWVRIALPGDLQGWAPGEAVIKVATRD
jgi:tetratricopeptide (TPR) repeat protein